MDIELDSRFQSSCGNVAYTAIGEGRDVVLVHGTPTSPIIWGGVVSRLAGGYRFHVLDSPGYGESEKFDGQEVRLRSFARVLREWLETKQLDRPILVGHDFGAATVLGAHLTEEVEIPSASMPVLPDAGHFSMLDTPGLFAEHLNAWISSL